MSRTYFPEYRVDSVLVGGGGGDVPHLGEPGGAEGLAAPPLARVHRVVRLTARRHSVFGFIGK